MGVRGIYSGFRLRLRFQRSTGLVVVSLYLGFRPQFPEQAVDPMRLLCFVREVTTRFCVPKPVAQKMRYSVAVFLAYPREGGRRDIMNQAG